MTCSNCGYKPPSPVDQKAKVLHGVIELIASDIEYMLAASTDTIRRHRAIVAYGHLKELRGVFEGFQTLSAQTVLEAFELPVNDAAVARLLEQP